MMDRITQSHAVAHSKLKERIVGWEEIKAVGCTAEGDGGECIGRRFKPFHNCEDNVCNVLGTEGGW